MNRTSIRQSNIELLRIISMVMVLCVHFIGATFGLPYKMTISDLNDVSIVSKTIMECFSIIGVNCFVLISGYFGIRPSVKGVVNFTMWCLFYAVAIYTIYAFAKPELYGANHVWESLRVLSNTDLWFVPAYFALYILSPILNRGTANIAKKEFVWLLVAISFVNVYLGWFWQGKVNPTGYNVVQLMYIYIIGRFLKQNIKPRRRYRPLFVLCYLVSFILLFVSTFFYTRGMAYAYNSPLVILASVFFFLYFTTLRIRNTYVNYIASSAFGVYLLHKMPPLWIDLKDFMINSSQKCDDVIFAVYWVIFVLSLFALCVMIDKLRFEVMKPIHKCIIHFIKRFV